MASNEFSPQPSNIQDSYLRNYSTPSSCIAFTIQLPTGLHIGTTTFQRLNLSINVYETAGQIGRLSNHDATVVFGVEEVNMKELRKAKESKQQVSQPSLYRA
ncbi:cral trio domain protein [Moniliophthora roreri]|nr:cral trio domain protein [Moniliophthora roreri]